MKDQPFGQKVASRHPTPIAVTGVAIAGDGSVWAGSSAGLLRWSGTAWEPAPAETAAVWHLCADPQGRLWVAAAAGVFCRIGSHWARVERASGARCVAADGEALALAGAGWVRLCHADQWYEFPLDPGLHVRSLYIDGGSVWCATNQGVLWWDGRAHHLIRAEAHGVLSDDVRALVQDRHGFRWAATARGVGVLGGRGQWHAIAGRDGLPCEDVHCLALGPDGSRWFGTARGVTRLKEGRWEYFAGRRWLPHDRVHAIHVEPDGAAWIATEGGLARIEWRTTTLEEKAAAFEERVAARHNRLGYVTSCHLEEPGDLDRFTHEASDNDGLWTALYVAAQAFQFAATGDEAARRRARSSVEALMRLEALTPLPGLPARAAVRKDERVLKSGGEWHDSPDGQWEWKGDTSSDEIDGHLFAYGVYHDLAATEEEKPALAAVVARILDHIIAHGFLLVDVDGEHTRWGVWSPRYLNDDPRWAPERGLNSLEILAHLRTAHHITGEPRFEEAYRHLIEKEQYALNTIRQKLTLPDGEVNHSDDELAFISYYPLLRYETDPDLRALYLMSLERSWQIERPERCPLWNVIYGALTGRPCDIEEALETLRRIPMDLVDWRMENSHRADVALDPECGRFGEAQSLVVLPPDERAVMKWNGNPFRLDGGGSGHSEDDGTFYLLPYWMARYHGLVRP